MASELNRTKQTPDGKELDYWNAWLSVTGKKDNSLIRNSRWCTMWSDLEVSFKIAQKLMLERSYLIWLAKGER